jgi:hypothetical protein
MKKQPTQEIIDVLEKNIEMLQMQQKAIYEYARHIGSNYADNNDVWRLKKRIEALEQILTKPQVEKSKDPSGWSFHTSFTYAMLVVNIILLLMIANKLL